MQRHPSDSPGLGSDHKWEPELETHRRPLWPARSHQSSTVPLSREVGWLMPHTAFSLGVLLDFLFSFVCIFVFLFLCFCVARDSQQIWSVVQGKGGHSFWGATPVHTELGAEQGSAELDLVSNFCSLLLSLSFSFSWTYFVKLGLRVLTWEKRSYKHNE